MKFYIHPINPNYSATSMDDYAKGWKYGLWKHPHPAREPSQYLYQCKRLEAAFECKTQIERSTLSQADVPVQGDWLTLPDGVDAHSDIAAQEVLAIAISQGRPVKWPWTELETAAA